MSRDGGGLRRADDDGVMDLRPMVWDAAMMAPAPDADVTVVLRVTYRTLEQICDDVCAVSRTATRRREATPLA